MEYLNARVYDYTGIERDPAAWSLRSLVHSDDLAAMFGAWRSSIASGDPYEAEARLLRADGAYRWFIVRASARESAKVSDVMFAPKATSFGAALRKSAEAARAAIENDRWAAFRDPFLAAAPGTPPQGLEGAPGDPG